MIKIKKGDKFSKLTAVSLSHRHKSKPFWLFRCECGKEKVIDAYNVTYLSTQSCGCILGQKVTVHGHKKGGKASPTYKSWEGAKYRCLSPISIGYKNYKGRGITMSKSWLDFNNFLRDMGVRPAGKSLDRINNNKGYSKENCRWATQSEQLRNTRINHLVTYKGKTKTLADWVEILGINRGTLRGRLTRGWSINKAFKK